MIRAGRPGDVLLTDSDLSGTATRLTVLVTDREKAGHQVVIEPKPLQAPVEVLFTADDFAIEEGTAR